jgi:hypothetical protein
MTTPIAKALLEDLNRLFEARYRPLGTELCAFIESQEKQKFQIKVWFNHIDRARSGKLSSEAEDQYVITLDTGEVLGRGFNGLGPISKPDSLWRFWEVEWNRDGRLRCKKCHNRWNPKTPNVPEQCPTCSSTGGGLSSIGSI